MGTPEAIITMGFGSWGSIGDVITLGYGSGDAAFAGSGAICFCAQGFYTMTPVAQGLHLMTPVAQGHWHMTPVEQGQNCEC